MPNNEQYDLSIRSAIQKIAGTYKMQRITLTTGNVESVDVASRTCVCTIENDIELTCKLMAYVGDGLLLKPSINSTVLIVYATYMDSYVLMCSDVDSIGLKGSELGGLVKVNDLVANLNNIENLVNDLISKFNTHTHVLTLSTGTGTAAPTTTQETNTLTPTNANDLENKNVTHGN